MGRLQNPRSWPSSARLLAAGLALIALLGPPPVRGAAQAGGTDGVEAQIAALLAEADFRSGRVDKAAELGQLGAPAVPALFEVLRRGSVPAGWVEEGSPAISLGYSQRKAVLGAFAFLPSREVRALLSAVSQQGYDPILRAIACQVVGTWGALEELELLVGLASPPSHGDVVPRLLRGDFSLALEKLLRREPDGVWYLSSVFGSLHPQLASPVIGALGVVGAEVGLEPLASCLGAVPELDALILLELSRLGSGARLPVERSIADDVRAYLSSEDRMLMQGAIATAAALEDYRALPRLIELLRESQGEDLGALRALQDITGLAFRADAGIWQRWYEGELAWWDEEAPGLYRDLSVGDAAEAIGAVRALSARRLFRHEAARELLTGLGRPEPGVVQTTCAALGRLASWEAVPDLVLVLENSASETREAARAALGAITGRDLPAEPVAWAWVDQ